MIRLFEYIFEGGLCMTIPQFSTKTYGITFIIITIVIISLLLSLSFQYFNNKEISALVDGANKNNLDYELIIHNQYLNTYSFKIINRTHF